MATATPETQPAPQSEGDESQPQTYTFEQINSEAEARIEEARTFAGAQKDLIDRAADVICGSTWGEEEPYEKWLKRTEKSGTPGDVALRREAPKMLDDLATSLENSTKILVDLSNTTVVAVDMMNQIDMLSDIDLIQFQVNVYAETLKNPQLTAAGREFGTAALAEAQKQLDTLKAQQAEYEAAQAEAMAGTPEGASGGDGEPQDGEDEPQGGDGDGFEDSDPEGDSDDEADPLGA